MTNIRFISTSTIRPASSSSDHRDDQIELISHRIELGPWDLRLLLYEHLQKGLLFHKPIDDHGDISLVDRLKASLSQALGVFYPLAGRLAVVESGDGTASFSVDCDGAGATFVHATIDGIAVKDVVEPDIVPDDIVYSFFPANGVLNCEAAVSKLPLLAVQVTELADGVFVACTMNHCVCDGTSFWRFFNVWAEISRRGGGGVISHSDHVFGREYLDGLIDLPIRIPFSYDEISNRRFVTTPLQQRMFRFSKEKISELRAKTNAETSTTYEISSLQALMAHLWVSVTRSRNLAADEEVTYRVVMGMRQRMRPPLPEEYFGNSVLSVMVKATAGELLGAQGGGEGGLGRAARKINRAVAAQTGVEAEKFLKDWAASPALPQVGKFPPNILMTGSSPRFDVYGNDFGWGRPVAVRSGPGTKFDGKLTVFPGAEEGSIDFEVCLRPETLRAMACDQEFMGFLS